MKIKVMNILILEDEIPAYQKLISYLKEIFGNDFSHDLARSNTDGKNLLTKNNYDFILSDIQLLDGISFELFEPSHILLERFSFARTLVKQVNHS